MADAEARTRLARSVLAVGTYPPPITGQSVAFATAVDGLGLPFVNISPRGQKADSAFSWNRAGEVLRQALAVLRASRGKRALYLTGASSLFGLLRDSLFILPAIFLGRRVVVHVHQGRFDGFLAGLPAPARACARWLYRRVFRVIVLAEAFARQFDFVRPGQVAVVPNGIPAREAPVAAPPGEEVRVLFLSNLMPQKGVLPLVEALSLLPDRFTCSLAGRFLVTREDGLRDEREFETIVRARIAALGLARRVTLAGVVAGEEKERLLARAHVLCLPTTYVNEAQPLCVLEAMMAGVPVVCTRHRDLPAMVSPEWGRLIDEPAPRAIADAILEVTRDPETWTALSRRAHREALARFSLEAHLAALARVLLEATV